MIQFLRKSFVLSLPLTIAVIFTSCSAQGDNESENEAAVNIVKYSDYQCPTCAYFHPIVEKVQELPRNYKGFEQLVYSYIPEAQTN